MARYASAAKLGYYPTPNEVVNILKQVLIFHDGIRILDPCCGDGEALARLTEGVVAERWGIELEKNRFHAAAGTLDHVLWGDAVTEIRHKGALPFDCVFLNPPYDTEDTDYDIKAERLEYRFLCAYFRLLCPNGLLIAILPRSSFWSRNLVKAMAPHMIGLYAFPDPHYEQFKQFVVFLRKKRLRTEAEIEINRALIDNVARMGSGAVDSLEKATPVEVPVVHGERPFSLESRRIDPEELYLEVAGSKGYRDFFNLAAPPSHSTIQPLIPLRKGHLAMLVAAGFCNGMAIEDPQTKRRFLVKGRVESSTEELEEESNGDQNVKIIRRSHKAIVWILDEENGLERIE